MNSNKTIETSKPSSSSKFIPLDFLEIIFYVYIPLIFVPVGLIGNILIIFAFSKKSLNVPKQHRYYYILTAIGDCVAIIGRQLLLTFLGQGLYALSNYTIIFYISTFSVGNCLFSYNAYGVGEMISNYTMAVFCIERFICIKFPLKAKSLINFKRVVISHFIIVAPLTLYEIFHITLTHNLVPTSSGPIPQKCGTDESLPYVVIMTLINNFVLKYGHMFISFIFNILLIIYIRKAQILRKKLLSNTTNDSSKVNVLSNSEITTAIIILLSSIVSLISWVTHSVLSQTEYILGNIAVENPAIKSGWLYKLCDKGYNLAKSILIFGHVINFWVLILKMKSFRNIIFFRYSALSSKFSSSIAQNQKTN